MCLPAVQLGLFRGHQNAARTPLPYARSLSRPEQLPLPVG